MTATDTPRWQRPNLTKHHQKRLKDDDACWREILNLSRPMLEIEYENESYAAYEQAVLEYEAEERDNPLRLYRVDKRIVKTVADLARSVMVTCYHEHFDRRHKTGSVHRPLVENTLRFLRNLDDRASGKIITLSRVELLKHNIKNHKHRARNSAIVLSIETLRRNHVEGTPVDASH